MTKKLSLSLSILARNAIRLMIQNREDRAFKIRNITGDIRLGIMDAPKSTAKSWVGEAVNTGGWATFFLSVFSGLYLKGSPIPGAIDLALVGFWGSLGVLGLGSVVYGVGAFSSKRWRSEMMQSRFSPYLLGSAGWLALILLLWWVARLPPLG